MHDHIHSTQPSFFLRLYSLSSLEPASTSVKHTFQLSWDPRANLASDGKDRSCSTTSYRVRLKGLYLDLRSFPQHIHSISIPDTDTDLFSLGSLRFSAQGLGRFASIFIYEFSVGIAHVFFARSYLRCVRFLHMMSTGCCFMVVVALLGPTLWLNKDEISPDRIP